MSLRKLICMVGVTAVFAALALPASAWEPAVQGYSQFRYEYSDSAGDGDFDTRRVRLSWKDEVNDLGTTVRVQLDFSDLLTGDGNSVSAKDIWVSHPFSASWSALVGFTTVPFGYELEYSSSKRLPFERSRAARSFFPGERGLGAFAAFSAQASPGVAVNLGLIDGMDAWDRDGLDDAESFFARAEVPFGNGNVAGVSYMTSDIDLKAVAAAQNGASGSGFSSDVFGAHVRYTTPAGGNRWALQAEYYDGDWYDHRNYALYDADGWYAQLEFHPTTTAVMPFYRYDEFNYSRPMSTTQEGGGQSEYSRHTFGVAYEPFANNRLTLQVEDIDTGSDDDTTVGVQWQVIYK